MGLSREDFESTLSSILKIAPGEEAIPGLNGNLNVDPPIATLIDSTSKVARSTDEHVVSVSNLKFSLAQLRQILDIVDRDRAIWPVETLHVEQIPKGTGRSTFRLQVNDQSLIISVHSKEGKKSEAGFDPGDVDVNQSHQYQQFLYSKGVSVPEMIGNTFELQGTNKKTQIQAFVDGYQATGPLTEDEMKAMAQSQARSHIHGVEFAAERGITSEGALPSGMVHCNIYPSNIIFQDGDEGKKAVLLDFEMAKPNSFLWDLCFTIRKGLCTVKDENKQTTYRFDPDRVGYYLREYNQIRPFEEKEYAAFPKAMISDLEKKILRDEALNYLGDGGRQKLLIEVRNQVNRFDLKAVLQGSKPGVEFTEARGEEVRTEVKTEEVEK